MFDEMNGYGEAYDKFHIPALGTRGMDHREEAGSISCRSLLMVYRSVL